LTKYVRDSRAPMGGAPSLSAKETDDSKEPAQVFQVVAV
jgi:hypothetical protein